MLPTLIKQASTSNRLTIVAITIWLTSCLLLAGLFYILAIKQYQALDKEMDTFGNTVAKLSASEAASSTANRDAISLQAIARNTIKLDSVESIIFYEVNNQIITQASLPQSSATLLANNYTAPIIYGDQLIGSVTVGIYKNYANELEPYLWLITIILLCSFITGCWFIYEQLYRATPQTDSTLHSTKANIPQSQEQEIQSNQIFLVITINNPDALYQQLNADLRKQQLDELESHISNITTVYGGKICLALDQTYILEFKQNSDEAYYNAVYCGYLIIEFNKQLSKSIINLNAVIKNEYDERSCSQMMNAMKKIGDSTSGAQNVFIELPAEENDNIEQQLDIEHFHLGFYKVINIKGRHGELLKNQLARLIENANRP